MVKNSSLTILVLNKNTCIKNKNTYKTISHYQKYLEFGYKTIGHENSNYLSKEKNVVLPIP
jgi:hypothetical protein